MSLNSGIPTVPDIIDSILKSFPISKDEIKCIKGGGIPFELFIQRLSYGSDITPLLDMFHSTIPNHAHKFMAYCAKRGFIKTFVTTNFDTLLEQELSAQQIPFSVFVTDQEFDAINFPSSDITIIKLHGTIDDFESIAVVLKKVVSKGGESALVRLIHRLFGGSFFKHVIFAGYSCSDKFDISFAIETIKTSAPPFITFIEHGNGDTIKSLGSLHPVFLNFPGTALDVNTDKALLELAGLFGEKVDFIKNNSNIGVYIEKWKNNIYSYEYILACLYFDMNHYSESERYAKKALAKALSLEDQIGISTILISILSFLGKTNEIAEIADNIIPLAYRLKDLSSLALALLNKANSKMLMNEHAIASELLDEAEAAINQISTEKENMLARLYASRAECFVELRDFQKASKMLDLAKRYAVPAGEIHSMVLVYRAEAKMAYMQGNYSKSVEIAHRAVALCEDLGVKRHLAGALLDCLRAHKEMASSSTLIQQLCNRVLMLGIELDDMEIQALAKGYLGMDFFSNGKFYDAADCFSFAIKHLHGILKCTYLLNLGLIKDRLKEYEESIKIYQDVISIFISNPENITYKDELRRAYLNLSLVLLHCKKYDEALLAAENSIAIAQELNNIRGEINARVNYGIAVYYTEDKWEDGAYRVFKDAYEIARDYYGEHHDVTIEIKERMLESKP